DTAFSMIVPLDTSNLRGLDLSVHQVRVSGIVNRIIQRRLGGIPISAIEGVVIQPGQVDVLLTGPRNRVDAIRPGDFRIVTAMDAIPTSIPPEGISVPLRIEQLRT